MDQVLVLLTTTILQMGGTLADAMKNNVKSAKDNNDFTSGVKVELPHLKDDHHAKVLEDIQLVILTVTLSRFGYVFEPSMVTLLSEKHSNTEMLDLSEDGNSKKSKAMQANDNAIAWLRMAFSLPNHQHEINELCTTRFPQGLVHEAIRQLKARVITGSQMELDSIKNERDG